MNKNDYRPLQEYLDKLPEPKTLKEKILAWWSNFIDDCSIFRMKIKMRRKKTS